MLNCGFPIGIATKERQLKVKKELRSLSKLFRDLILFEVEHFEFIVENIWSGLVWIDNLDKHTK